MGNTMGEYTRYIIIEFTFTKQVEYVRGMNRLHELLDIGNSMVFVKVCALAALLITCWEVYSYSDFFKNIYAEQRIHNSVG